MALEREVIVYLCDPTQIDDPVLLASYEALLSAAESAHYERLDFEEDRRQYLVSRALCRWALSNHASCEPHEWAFKTSADGRPDMEPDCGLSFYLAETPELIACAVTKGRDLGVDAEEVRDFGDVMELAREFFSPTELEHLEAEPAASKQHFFLRIWALKESFIRASGRAMTLGLNHFALHISAEQIEMSFKRRIDDDPKRWQFSLEEPTPGHVLAVSVGRVQDEPPVAIRSCWVIPLGDP
jgi:4'-phosphopantetheinyl transferase